MNRTTRTRMAERASQGLLFAMMIAIGGCSDKVMPTQPPPPTPTPPGGTQYRFTVSLSKIKPPSGYKHAAHADITVTVTGGRALQLTGVRAMSYYQFLPVSVLGFSPLSVPAGQTKSFRVDFASRDDIACEEGLLVELSSADENPRDTFVGCGAGEWPF